jgi:serine/threonine-protein kinase
MTEPDSITPPSGTPTGVMPLVPGYRMLRALASGGMGSVFAAEQLSTHQTFAVKLIREEYARNEPFVRRFEREVAALREIRHPNVVHVYEWRLPAPGDPSPPFVVMELLHGEGLDARLRREKRVDPLDAVGILLQVLDAVAAAHRVGVLHRDLGPSNVFLVPQPEGPARVKVLDFGLARATEPTGDESDVTRPGTVLGKPGYVPPEVVAARTPDERADVFACGMLLFRMLAGRLPFRQRRAEMLWAERFAELGDPREYPPPSDFEPDVPAALERIVMRAIRRDPASRFGSAREMQNTLLAAERAVATNDPASSAASPAAWPGRIDPPPLPPVAGTASEVRAAPRRRRARGPWVIAAALLLAGTGVAAAWMMRGGDGTVMPSGSPPAAAEAPVPAPAARPPVLPQPHEIEVEAVVPPEIPPAATTPRPTTGTVSVTFEGVPEGAVLRVSGHAVTGTAVHLPPSDSFVPFEVEAPGFETYRGSVLPTEDRVVRVVMRATEGAEERAGTSTTTTRPATTATSANSSAPTTTTRPATTATSANSSAPTTTTTIQGRGGTEFATEYE